MRPIKTIETIELFPVLHEHLMTLLQQMQPDDWHLPTVLKGWNVKDIVSHIIDGNFRRVAMYRDHYMSPDVPVIDSYQSLVGYLNKLNHDWVIATRRMSPAQLIEWLTVSGPQVYSIFSQLPPDGQALFSVAWAGEETSSNWFHIAREYTELWHHQQQIRLAVNQPEPLMKPELYYPVMDAFMQALPHTYKAITASEGTLIKFSITNLTEVWHLYRNTDAWQLVTDVEPLLPITHVSIDGQLAWRLFTKGLSVSEAVSAVNIEGDRSLGEPVLKMVSVMA